jgi:hypothetical protein
LDFLAPAGLWTGISYPDPMGVTLSISPGHGELIEIPMLSFVGQTTGLLFECVPGGELEGLAQMKYGTAPHHRAAVVPGVEIVRGRSPGW